MGRYNGTLKLYRRNIFLILSLLESCIIDVKRCVNYEDKYLIVQKSCKYLFREQTMLYNNKNWYKNEKVQESKYFRCNKRIKVQEKYKSFAKRAKK